MNSATSLDQGVGGQQEDPKNNVYVGRSSDEKNENDRYGPMKKKAKRRGYLLRVDGMLTETSCLSHLRKGSFC